jgi:KamA family protein
MKQEIIKRMKQEIIKLTKLSEKQFKEINKLYPIKISSYLLKQIKKSKFIAKQFLPSVQELRKDIPIKEPFKGLLKTDIKGFERLYEDRVVFKLTSSCPAHCRFCYRRGYVFGEEKIMSKRDIQKAINFVRKDNTIRNVLLTGGTPLLLGTKYIEDIIKRVISISHINQIYFALGRPIMNPDLITDEFAEMLAKYNKPTQHKNIACTVHINHPDELTPEVIKALTKLTSRGITVWTQTTLLKGINDNEKTLAKLYQLFRSINLIPYYLIHAMPMIGTSHYRTSVERGVKIMKYLEQYSGHERPIYIVIPSVGKVQLTGNTELKYKTINGERYVVLKTPYKVEKFFKVNKINRLPEKHFVDKEGYIIAYYLDGKD